MEDFSLKQIEVFAAVAELGSFTKAGEKLFLTQSTVSSHVSGLEKALGVKLLQRSTKKKISLTPEGERIFPAAQRILSDCRNMKRLAENETYGLPLSIGASTVPAQCLLPDILAGYLKDNPDCKYILRRGDSAQIHEYLKSGQIGIGFVGSRLDPDSFDYYPVEQDRLVLVTENSEYYRSLQRKGVQGRDLLGEPTIAREEGSGTDRAVRNYRKQIGLPEDDMHIVARIDNPVTIKMMVARGAGVSVLSELAVRSEVRSGQLLQFDMDETGLMREIYMIRRKNARSSQQEQMFADYATSLKRRQPLSVV